MEIRFASIPKTASRTLQVFGLLGATNERPHMPIREYPEWEKYDWHVVRRPTWEWLESWWHQASKSRSEFTTGLGMKLQNMTADLAILDNPPEIPLIKKLSRFDSWMPTNFSGAYKPFHGRFQDFCYSMICDGVPCKTIELKDLDSWLIANGKQATHYNRTVK